MKNDKENYYKLLAETEAEQRELKKQYEDLKASYEMERLNNCLDFVDKYQKGIEFVDIFQGEDREDAKAELKRHLVTDLIESSSIFNGAPDEYAQIFRDQLLEVYDLE